MRDYDPTTGRYVQADPLGLIDGASVYGYALQNPGKWIDPRGEQTATMDGPVSLPKGAIGGGTALGEIVGWCVSRLALPLALVWPNQMADGTVTCGDQAFAENNRPVTVNTPFGPIDTYASTEQPASPPPKPPEVPVWLRILFLITGQERL